MSTSRAVRCYMRCRVVPELPLDFHGRVVRVVRSMYLPAALHGVEASLLALDSLRKLRSSICRVVLVSSSALSQCRCRAEPFGWAYWGVTLLFV